jgi:GH25 family lysozyme M1 (1,4-beta-N-acetylmuramidase)
MEYVDNDTSRIETLTRSEKTKIALAFLNRIKEAGYTGMLYGDKEWLLKRIDLSQFDTYDIWYAEEADIPDYPYRYSMWQYTRQGEVYGIDGYVDLNISFLDYSAR